MSNKMALDALKKIAAMDAEGVRADDLGRAAVVARAAIAALEAERLAAQSAPTGLTDMGWVIDAATKGELAAYDQGIAESIQAVTKILDGKDAGAGIANRPWEPLRRRLLALVAQSAPLAQQREYPPLPVKECAAIWPAILDWYGESPGADTYEKSHAVDQAITAAMRAYVDAALAAAQVEPSAPPAPGGDVLERRSETGMPMSANAPEKCPITRRPFFMVISHPELGWVPTYGGPYDSYTIPHMEGKPDEPYHERELTCHHYDHDYGGWVDDESISMRVINEGVLNALQSTQAPCPYEPHPSGICTKCGKAHAPTATQGQDAAPAERDALQARVDAEPEGFTQGIDATAKMLDKMADDYLRAHAIQDPDTGVYEFGWGVKEDYYNILRELADDVRSIVYAPGERENAAQTLKAAKDAAFEQAANLVELEYAPDAKAGKRLAQIAQHIRDLKKRSS